VFVHIVRSSRRAGLEHAQRKGSKSSMRPKRTAEQTIQGQVTCSGQIAAGRRVAVGRRGWGVVSCPRRRRPPSKSGATFSKDNLRRQFSQSGLCGYVHCVPEGRRAADTLSPSQQRAFFCDVHIVSATVTLNLILLSMHEEKSRWPAPLSGRAHMKFVLVNGRLPVQILLCIVLRPNRRKLPARALPRVSPTAINKVLRRHCKLAVSVLKDVRGQS